MQQSGKPKQAYVCPGTCKKEIAEGRCCEDGKCDYADPPEVVDKDKPVSKPSTE